MPLSIWTPASANWPDSDRMTPTLTVSWALAEAVAATKAAAPSSAANDLRMNTSLWTGPCRPFGRDGNGCVMAGQFAGTPRLRPTDGAPGPTAWRWAGVFLYWAIGS